MQERELDDVVPEKALRNRMRLLSLTLLPWLVRLWSEERLIEDESMKTLEEQFIGLGSEFRGGPDKLTFTKVSLDGPPDSVPSILDLLRFRLPETFDAQSYVAMTVGKINSQRLYRSPNRLRTRPKQVVPTTLQHKEVAVPDEELEHEWTFGVKFEVEDDGTLPWWVIIQDPANEARMLVGCFTHRPPARDGFLWAETNQEVLTHHSLNEILGLSQTIMICKKTEAGVETWSSMHDEDEVVESGILELIGQGHSTVGHLRAMRQTFTEENRTRPSSGTRPSESFYMRVTDSLRRHLEAVTMPTNVTVYLEMMDNTCQVSLVDEEDEVLQDITIEYTADLIALLRWPLVKGGPMFTDSGNYVTWSVFDDIQYKDLDFIGPYVTFRAARTSPEELPRRLAQFFGKSETLRVGIEHDASVCPIAMVEELDHGTCWRIMLPHDCSDQVKRQLGEVMTGEEVNGLLAPGKLYAGVLYEFDLTTPTVSEKDESVVFHEELYIRMLLRKKGLILKRLKPGTYLRIRDQKWMVDITWDGAKYAKWSAQSIVSGLYFGSVIHTIELLHGHGAKEECERILDIITSNIPCERIEGFEDLKENVLSNLKGLGYLKTSPTCELRIIEQSETTSRYGVFPVNQKLREPFLTGTIEVTGDVSPDVIIETFEEGMIEGEMSAYSIRNVSPFLKKIATWIYTVAPDMDNWSEYEDDSKEWTVALYVEQGERAIYWTAEQNEGEEIKTEQVFYDIVDLGVREAIRNLREILKLDLVSQLGHISNLDEVLRKQVPAVVHELHESS